MTKAAENEVEMDRQTGPTPVNDRPARRLLDRVRDAIRVRHYSYRTAEAYVGWIRRYILFHSKRHPQEMGIVEINSFLTHLAVDRKVSASTQDQTLAALLFLYQEVLKIQIGWMDIAVRATKPRRLPVVLNRAEVREVLHRMSGVLRVIANLFMDLGSGFSKRSSWVKDIEFERNEIVVRDGKGQRDRATMLPQTLTGIIGSFEKGPDSS